MKKLFTVFALFAALTIALPVVASDAKTPAGDTATDTEASDDATTPAAPADVSAPKESAEENED